MALLWHEPHKTKIKMRQKVSAKMADTGWISLLLFQMYVKMENKP